MAGCYFYTGGWAAACWKQRPVEPFIRWPKDALSGALQLTGLLGWMQLLVFPHNGYSITAEQETTKQNVLIPSLEKPHLHLFLALISTSLDRRGPKKKHKQELIFHFTSGISTFY